MLDSNAKAKISKSKMEEMKDILKAESERKEKKPPDLNRLDKFSKFNYSYAVSFKEKAGEPMEFEKVGNIKKKIWDEKKPPDKIIFSNNNNKKVGEARKVKKNGNLKGMIQEEKKTPDMTVFVANKEKVGKAVEFEKVSKLERKRLVFNINCKVRKMLVFRENKNKAKLKSMKKQDLHRFEHNAKAKMDLWKLKDKKPQMFGEKKIKAKHNVIKYNSKMLRNVKKQDVNKEDHNAKAKMDVMKLKEKKPLMFG